MMAWDLNCKWLAGLLWTRNTEGSFTAVLSSTTVDYGDYGNLETRYNEPVRSRFSICWCLWRMLLFLNHRYYQWQLLRVLSASYTIFNDVQDFRVLSWTNVQYTYYLYVAPSSTEPHRSSVPCPWIVRWKEKATFDQDESALRYLDVNNFACWIDCD